MYTGWHHQVKTTDGDHHPSNWPNGQDVHVAAHWVSWCLPKKCAAQVFLGFFRGAVREGQSELDGSRTEAARDEDCQKLYEVIQKYVD